MTRIPDFVSIRLKWVTKFCNAIIKNRGTILYYRKLRKRLAVYIMQTREASLKSKKNLNRIIS